MPSINVHYRHGFMEEPVADAIKRSVRRYGIRYFRGAETKFDERNFSFKFHRPEKYDDLTADIFVYVDADFLTERRDVHEHARMLADLIAIDDDMPLDALINLELTCGLQVGHGVKRARRPRHDYMDELIEPELN